MTAGTLLLPATTGWGATVPQAAGATVPQAAGATGPYQAAGALASSPGDHAAACAAAPAARWISGRHAGLTAPGSC